mgnify:CR=1 FL=1
MPGTVKIGLIGAGMIGDVLIGAVRRDGRADVTHIAARTEQTLRDKLRKFGIPCGTTDYRELLRDPALDAVIIASPPFTHLKMTRDALGAGKHVLLEKPMAIRHGDLETFLETAARHPDLTVLDCSCRHTRLTPRFRMIRDIVDSGALGEIYHIHHRALTRGTFIEYNPAGAWAHRRELAGGGPFLDLGVYDLAFHLGLMDDRPRLRSVRSFTRGGLKHFPDPAFESDIEEHGAAWMEFDTGLTWYYERGAGLPCEAPNRTHLHGTRGSLRFGYNSWDPPELEFFHMENGKEILETRIMPSQGGEEDNLELIRHFLDVILDGAEPRMPVELAARHLDILFRILSG